MPKSVTEQYPELLHYTTENGLRGILESGCLWASHASFLNDAEELTHFFDARLGDLAYAECLAAAERVPDTPHKQKVIGEAGGLGALTRADATRVTDLLKRATMGFHEPYVLSLSAPSDARVAGSGLLSQWRGYGGDGGYALVLDTLGLDVLLRQEVGQFYYQFAQWGDVFYYGVEADDQPSSEEVADYEKVVRDGVLALISGHSPDTVPELYDAVTSLSCLYKHWGFAEEREVRVVAIPSSEDISSESASAGELRQPRRSKFFLRRGLNVPYIELFKNLGANGSLTRLPIKRVIVGPHREKRERASRIRALLAEHGYVAEVTCSEIPYLGS